MSTRPVALVTGARRGIGRATCAALAAKGFDLVGADLTEDGAAETAGAVEAAGGRFAFRQADVAALEGHAALLDAAWDAFGGLECLVNNAGVGAMRRGDLLEVTPDSWDRAFGVNVRAGFFLAQGVARRMLAPGAPGRGTLEKEKPPIFGMIERGGQVVIRMLANVQQATIHPIIEKTVAKGSNVYTDEYSIYARLPGLGYGHKTVCHGRGEYARDEDGDGFCEVNTLEGFWSLLRSWLRPHRGISQEKLPLYLGFFQFVHNTRRRGKALLGSLIEALVA